MAKRNEFEGKWAISLDEESYGMTFSSKADAWQECKGGEFVGACVSIDPSQHIDAERIVDDLVCNSEDFCFDFAEGYLSDNVNSKQLEELTEAFQDAFANWLDKYELWPSFYKIDPTSVEQVLGPIPNG